MVEVRFKKEDIENYKQGPLEFVLDYGGYMYLPFYVKIDPNKFNGELVSFGDLPQFLQDTIISTIHEQIDPSKSNGERIVGSFRP